jgi:tetratricopeptide (TPR) repeat protein
MTNKQVKQFLEQQQNILEQLSKKKGKDSWDKLATLSTFVSSIVIGIIGIYFANAYKAQEIAFKAQEVRIAETQLVEKFVPILAGTDENAKKGALLAIASLSNRDLAIRLGTSYASAGTIEAMEIMLKSAEGESKNLLLESLPEALLTRASSENDKEGYRDYNRTIKDIDKILSLKLPDELKTKNDGYFLADCYRVRGFAYGGLGKYELAYSDYMESLKIIPNYPYAYWNLGQLYWWRTDSQHSKEKALSFLDQAIDNKAYGSVFYDRGRLHREMGNFDKSLSDFNQYIDFRPNDPWGYYERALTYLEKKDLANAHQDLKKARGYAFAQNEQAGIDRKLEEVERQMNISTPKKMEETESMPPLPPPPPSQITGRTNNKAQVKATPSPSPKKQTLRNKTRSNRRY